MTQVRDFNKGDRVRHKQIKTEGTVVRYFRPTWWANGMVFWRGWDPLDPDRIDWTWDFAMEHVR